MRAVAQQAGVSVTTVANVLNRPEIVAPPTRMRVEEAMKRVGFVRNGLARQLRGVPSRLVGVVVLDIANPFYAEVNRGIEDRLAEDQCMMLLCSIGPQADKETQTLTWLQEQGVRGIVISPVRDDPARLEEISGQGTPVVLLDYLPDEADLCAVGVDHYGGGRLTGDHLLELGHRRIAFLGGPTTVKAVKERRQGLRDALQDAGLDLAHSLVDIDMRPANLVDAADAAIDRLMLMKDPVTAIVCMNDMAALGVLQGLDRHGVRVPDEMSVVGYDDIAFASHLTPALTTVRQPTYELGCVAAELLLEEAEPGHRHRTVCFPPQLIVRASTADAR
ncbi:LacI family DNA-binding transcriptional regulator [Microbispora sp. CA-135349]|uniref:LacI family DNA-binding transcriptional regulator n=1 Tax=Microbispora sp. CA-135349 TaxID=3239953 RepID=UPI003D92D70F